MTLVPAHHNMQRSAVLIEGWTAADIEAFDADQAAIEAAGYGRLQTFLASDTGDLYTVDTDWSVDKAGTLSTAGNVVPSVDANGDIEFNFDAAIYQAGAISTTATALAGASDDFDSWTEFSGYQRRLMLATDTNGPGTTAGHTGLFYVRVVKFTQNGLDGSSGNCTQFLEPYGTDANTAAPMWARYRFNDVWSAWIRLNPAGGGGATTLAELDTSVTGAQLDTLHANALLDSDLHTDGTFATAPATAPAAASAVKTYVDTEIAGVGGGVTAYEDVLASDATFTSNDALADGLVLSALPVGHYILEGLVQYECGSGIPKIKILLTDTGGVATRKVGLVVGPGDSDVSPEEGVTGRAVWGEEHNYGTGDIPDMALTITGRVEVTTTGFIPKIQWAQGASNANTLTIRAGSYLRATKTN